MEAQPTNTSARSTQNDPQHQPWGEKVLSNHRESVAQKNLGNKGDTSTKSRIEKSPKPRWGKYTGLVPPCVPRAT